MTLKLGSHSSSRNTQKVIMYAQVINFSKTSDWRGAEQETGTSRYFFWRKDHNNNNISILVHRTTRQLQGLGLCVTIYYLVGWPFTMMVGSLSSVKVPWQKVNSKELKGEQAEEWDFINAGHSLLAGADTGSSAASFLWLFCLAFVICSMPVQMLKKVGWIWIRSLHDMLC